MGDPSVNYLAVPRTEHQEQHANRPAPDDGAGLVSRKLRCRLAVGSGLGFTDEMSCLLRTRLRLAILLILAGLAIHFLRNVLRIGPTFDHRSLWLLFCSFEIALMAIG